MLFYMPTKIYSEKNCVKNHGEEMAAFGDKAMIVTGKRSSRKNGSLSDVEESLKEQGVSYVIFDDVEENPSIETVMKAREIGIKESVDFVIGIGGGSPLDAAKAIALMIANPNETEEVLYNPKELSYLPVVCVPTTCGTGSEVTPYAILTIHKRRTKKSIKYRIYPELALLDAEYLKSMPRERLVNTAVDALAHLVESYLNTNSNEWNRTYSREGLAVWAQFKDRLKNNQLEEDDYERLLRASSLAGMAITHTSTSMPHGLSYPLTYEMGLPHGKAVGVFLAGFVDVYEDKCESSQVLKLLGFQTIDEFKSYMKDVLGEVPVEKALLETSVKNILADTTKMKNYPFALTEKDILAMKGDE